MTTTLITIIALLVLALAVVLKGNRNLMDDNRRKDATIRTLRSRLRDGNHEQ